MAGARCIAKGQHAALHDAERDTRCAGTSPREVAHAERRWRMHGGKTPPAEAAPLLMRGKARFLRLVRGRLAAT
jgi:hypothetical protein